MAPHFFYQKAHGAQKKGHGVVKKGHGAAPFYFSLDKTLFTCERHMCDLIGRIASRNFVQLSYVNNIESEFKTCKFCETLLKKLQIGKDYDK